MAVALTKRRFTVDEYHRMAEVGILTEDDRVELIDGEIVEMTPIGARHAWCVLCLNEFFVKHLADRALVSPQGPLRLGKNTQLQPDLALLRPPRDAYRKTVPASADVLLVIEVADTSLERDRAIKLPRYAALDIRDVWIVDVEGQAVEVYRAPSPSGYRDAQRVALDGFVSPAAFPDLCVSVAELLG